MAAGETDPGPSLSSRQWSQHVLRPLTRVMMESPPLTDAEPGENALPSAGKPYALPHSVTALTTAGPDVQYFHHTSLPE